MAMSDRMKRISSRTLGLTATHLTAFILGGIVIYLAWLPVSLIWGVVFGVEVHSQASFPMYHIARIYTAPGIGDQQLICTVDGWTVHRTGDWEPGNVDEKVLWDETGTVVKFIASGQTIYVYDTKSQTGWKE